MFWQFLSEAFQSFILKCLFKNSLLFCIKRLMQVNKKTTKQTNTHKTTE